MLLTSCLNPDDIFPLRGAVSTPGQRVTLQRAPQATPDECADEFVPFKETTADADGGYTFEIFRAQAQSLSTGFNFCFRAATTYASGTEAHVVTRRVDDEVHLPLLPDWHAQLRLSRDGGAIVVGVDDPTEFLHAPIAVRTPGDTGLLDQYSVELRGADGRVQWRQGDSAILDASLAVIRTPLLADGRILREFGGGVVRMTGTYTRASEVIEAFNAETRTVWTPLVTATSGDTYVVAGPERVPPSRGASCDGYDVCPFTDGVLAPAPVIASPVMLRFAQPFVPSFLVVRGAVTTPVVTPDEQPALIDGVVVAGFGPDGGTVGQDIGVGGLLAFGPFVHDFDGPVMVLDGGALEYPPTYLAIPITCVEPVAALRLTTPALRIDEISVW